MTTPEPPAPAGETNSNATAAGGPTVVHREDGTYTCSPGYTVRADRNGHAVLPQQEAKRVRTD